MTVLTDLKNRGVADVFFIVCDGLKGLPHSVASVFTQAIVQTCIVHLVRGTFRYASKKYWEPIAKEGPTGGQQRPVPHAEQAILMLLVVRRTMYAAGVGQRRVGLAPVLVQPGGRVPFPCG